MELESIRDGEEYPDVMRRRARCVILSAGGMMHKDVAAETGMGPNWVTTWVDRYNAEGVDGLRDRPRSGRRGGDPIPDAASSVREVMAGEAPEGGWTAEAVADRLGVGVGTVRGAARSAGISFERAREWEFDTADEVRPRGADVVGLFVSAGERAIVVSSAEGTAPTGAGRFSTRNSALAADVRRAAAGAGVGLAGVLSLAAAHAADGGRFSQARRLDAWLDGVVGGLSRVPGATHTVVLMSELPSAKRLLRHPGICFVRVEGEREWEAVAASHLGVGSGGGEASSLLGEALGLYLSSRVEGTETFAWAKRAVDDSIAGDDGGCGVAGTDCNAEPAARVASDDGGDGIAGVGDGTDGDGGSDGARARITVEYVDSTGEASSATVEVGGLMDPADCDPTSGDSLLSFVSGLERGLIPAVDRAGRLVGEAALASATKKNSLGRG